MADPLVVCPTHGRAGEVRVFKLLPEIPLCVSESQMPLYREAYPNAELISHPDSVKGIAPKRQWMLDELGDCIMFDDDVTGVSDVTAGAGEKAAVTDPAKVVGLMVRLMGMAAEIGAHVCGLSSYAHPLMFRPQNVFSLKQMIGSGIMGLRRSDKVMFPPKADLLNDDLYISALGLHHDRVVLTDLRYAAVIAKTWTGLGGMQGLRTQERMREDEKYLQMVFGEEAIRRRVSTHWSTVRSELQLQLTCPW
jgi:hypothetical protein